MMKKKPSNPDPTQAEDYNSTTSRRGFLANVLMGIGLVLSYGMLAVQGLLFIIPARHKIPTSRPAPPPLPGRRPQRRLSERPSRSAILWEPGAGTLAYHDQSGAATAAGRTATLGGNQPRRCLGNGNR